MSSQQKKNAYEKLCRDSNIIRETYYGTTHRETFTVNQKKSAWDILHITIPFAPKKEAEFMRRFGLEREDLPGAYAEFKSALVRHTSIVAALADLKNEAINKSVVRYNASDYFAENDPETGVISSEDFYFITAPMDSFVGSDVFGVSGVRMRDLLNLGVRMLQTAKVLNDNGFTMGPTDLDSWYVSEEDDRKFLRCGYFFYGTSPAIKPDIYGEHVQKYLPESVLSGMDQNFDSDIFMICSMLWNILGGNHYRDVPDFEIAPMYASDELTKLLYIGTREGSAALKKLQIGLRSLAKQIDKGELGDVYIPFRAPAYESDPLPPEREDAEPKKSAAKKEKKKKTVATGGKKPVITAIMFVALLIMIGFTVFTLGWPRGGGQSSGAAYSSEIGLYAYNGRVLNEDGTEAETYLLDGDGNLISESDPATTLYTAAYVSPYLMLEDVNVGILSREYTPNEEQTGGAWRYVLQLQKVPFDATAPVVIISSEESEILKFTVWNGEEYIDAAAIRQKLSAETTEISMTCSEPGKHRFKIACEVSGYEKQFALNFEYPEGQEPEPTPELSQEPMPSSEPAPSPEPTPDPTPETTPIPTPVLTPEPTPVPTPVPTPEPTPEPELPSVYVPYIPQGGGGSTYTPTESVREPSYETTEPENPAVQVTPRPDYEDKLSWDVKQIELSVGETYRLANILNGIQSGGNPFTFSDRDIVYWDGEFQDKSENGPVTRGYVIKALKEGTCTIKVTQNGLEATLTVVVK